METHVSVPPRALDRERRDVEASTDRIDEFAFWYFFVSLALALVAVGWVLLTL